MRVEFVDWVKTGHGGVQPVLEALQDTPAQIASATYYAYKSRPVSARSVRDEQLIELIVKVHKENMEVYGVRKVWHELRRQGQVVARCTVERLMRQAGLKGVLRDKHPRTTRPAAETERPADLVKRAFTASRPNQLWVADLTYVRTTAGWVYVAFILDVYSRMIVGWQVATSLYTELALDALQLGIWRRHDAGQDLTGLIHHSDRGVQYRALRYTQRLADAEAVASVGSKGDSYDNAMAEALNSLFKAELVRGPARRGKGLWRGIDELEIAVVEWVDWYNQRRLHSELGYLPPVEYEAAYWARHTASSVESHSTAGGINDDDHTASHDQTNPVLVEAETN